MFAQQEAATYTQHQRQLSRLMPRDEDEDKVMIVLHLQNLPQ